MLGNEAPYLIIDYDGGSRHTPRPGLHRRLTLRNLLTDLNLNGVGLLRHKTCDG